MKKVIILAILLASLVVLGGIIDNHFPEQEYIKNENINLAIYLNEEKIENIPSKESGYLFDEENSFCTNDASVLWDYASWSPIIKNVTNYSTRCTLIFRNFYRVKVYDKAESFAYQIPLNESSISFDNNSSHTLLSCNNGVYVSEENNFITINNITSDVTCTYYDNSLDALANLDDSINFFLYLKDESLTDNFVVQTGKNLIMNLNEHTFTINKGDESFALINYGTTTIKNGMLHGRIATHFMMELYDVTIAYDDSTINPYENSTLKIYDSKIYSNTNPNASTIWMHSANLEVYNSYIEGAYAIGGAGGNILIDSSELVGTFHNALQINEGFSGNIQVLNASILKGENYGIWLGQVSGELILKSTVSNQVPFINGETAGIEIGSDVQFNFEAGDIFGSNEPIIEGNVIVPNDKKMVTVNENGVYHTYLQ